MAKYADACNIFEMGVDGIRQKLDVLQSHCDNEGRPYAEIEKTTLGRLSLSGRGGEGTLSVDQAVQRFGQLAEIGVDQAIVSMPGVHDPASFELMPALVEQLDGITPSGR